MGDETSDEGQEQPIGGETTVLGHRLRRLPRTIAVAAALGAIGGLATVAFIRVLEGGQHLLWTSIPEALGIEPNVWFFVIPVVLIGAVLLGLARHHLGEYPVTIEDAIEDHKRTGEFDHRHVWQAAVISFISLGFGAALGPEAALMAILGGLGSWIARVIDANTTEGSDISFVGISGAMGALFGTAGAAMLTFDPRGSDADDAKSGRLLRVVPGLAAAFAGLLVYRHLGSSSSYFDLGLPDYSLTLADLAWSVPVALVSALAGLVFLAVGRGTDRLLAPLDGRPILESVAGGLGFALLATRSSLVLFSGHEGTDTLITGYGADSVGFLVAVAIAKLIAAALLLSAKWKGGRFFPLMFVGAALGLAMSQGMSAIGEVPALAAGMTAVVGVLMRRPVLAVGLMVLFFPIAAWPVVVLAAVIGATAGTRIGARIEDH